MLGVLCHVKRNPFWIFFVYLEWTTILLPIWKIISSAHSRLGTGIYSVLTFLGGLEKRPFVTRDLLMLRQQYGGLLSRTHNFQGAKDEVGEGWGVVALWNRH